MSIQLTLLPMEANKSSVPREYFFEQDSITIGSGAENDLIIDDPHVARKHVRVEAKKTKDGFTFYLTNLERDARTLIDDTELKSGKKTAVQKSDRIVVGNYLMTPDFEIESESSTEEQKEEGTVPSRGSWVDTIFGKVAERPKSEGDENSGDDSFDYVLSAETNNEQSPETKTEIIELKENQVEESPASESEQSETEVVEVQKMDTSSEFSFTWTVTKEDDKGVSELCFEAVRLCTIGGVVKHKGTPLSGVEIQAGELGTVSTDDKGRFEFADVPEDAEYEISFSKEKFIFSPEVVKGKAKDHAEEVTVDARELLTFRGRIVHNGTPLVGVEVDAGKELGTTVTDDSGEYCFENVPEGLDCTVTLKKDGFNFRSLGKASNASGETAGAGA